jgi:hypothetical protein
MQMRKLYGLHTRLMVPPYVINSLPKAGTHLLGKVMRMFPGVRFAGVEIDNSTADKFPAPQTGAPTLLVGVDWPVPFAREAVREALRGMTNGQFATWHAPYSDDLAGLVTQLNLKTLLMLRDPRDVVVSHARFLATADAHFLYLRYQALSASDQLMASITGLEPATPGDPGMLDIGTRCRSVSGWNAYPLNCTTTFEKLVGPQGGGSQDAQIAEIARLADHVGLRYNRAILLWISERVFGGTKTFHKGAIGGWRERFSPEHKRAFKDVAGSILVEWGYETDDDW